MTWLLRPSGGLWLAGGLTGEHAGTSSVVPSNPLAVVQQVVAAAAASASATSLSVNVLSAALPAGTQLRFSGGTLATLSAQANAGDSSLTVTALPGGVAAGETASGSVNVVMIRRVSPTMPAPTLVSGRPT